MFLADPDDIRTDLGCDAMPDIMAAIEAGLDTAEQQLAADLRTVFEQKTRTDIFMVVEPQRAHGRMLKTKFLLSQGFVTDAPIGYLVTAEPPTGAVSDAAPAGVVVDRSEGTLVDFVTIFDNQFVIVTYTAGFAASSANPKSYNLNLVPTWLQEAAKVKTKLNISQHPSLKDVPLDTDLLRRQDSALISVRRRYAPSAITPV